MQGSRLKPLASKGARAVSRGGGGGNASPLPDRTSETPTDHFEREPLWSSKEEFNAQISISDVAADRPGRERAAETGPSRLSPDAVAGVGLTTGRQGDHPDCTGR